VRFRFPEKLYREYEKFKRFDPMIDERKHLIVPAHVVGLRNRVFDSVRGRTVELVSPERETGKEKSYDKVKITSKTLFDKVFTTHIAWELHNELDDVAEGFAKIHRSISTLSGYDNFYNVKLDVQISLKGDGVHDLWIVVPHQTIGMLTFAEELSPVPLSFMYCLGVYHFCRDYGAIPEPMRNECRSRYETSVKLLRKVLEIARAKLMPEEVERELLEKLERRALPYHEVAVMGDAAIKKAIELVSRGILEYDEKIGFYLRRRE